ncbi:MAG TPA: STAS domain-containing protein [Methylophilaceae bacterium]
MSGNLLLDDVEQLLAQNLSPNGSAVLEIDLAGVGEVDSVAVSLLFEWVRQAHTRRCKVVYRNLPSSLVSLASLYGVLDFLPQTAEAAASH